MLHSRNRPKVDCVSIDRFNAAIVGRAGRLEFRIITHPQVLPLHDLFAGFRPSIEERHDGYQLSRRKLSCLLGTRRSYVPAPGLGIWSLGR